jgi:hypothetical protein
MTTHSYGDKPRRVRGMTLLIAAAAIAAIVLLLKPASANGLVAQATRVPESPTRSVKLQRIVHDLVAAG